MRLQTCAPQSKVIILTVHREPVYVTLAFHAGACGYLLKRTALRSELPDALLHVLAGDRYIGLGVRERVGTCRWSRGFDVEVGAIGDGVMLSTIVGGQQDSLKHELRG